MSISTVGLVSYYRRYITQFSTIAAPLTHLTQRGVNFEWTANCDVAFSAYGLGAVLEQNNHVIAYASYTLSKSE